MTKTSLHRWDMHRTIFPPTAEHRYSHLCAITFSSQTCIYISDQYWEFPQSGNQLRHHKNLESFFHCRLCLCVHTTIRKKGQSPMYPSRYNGLGALEAPSLSVLDP